MLIHLLETALPVFTALFLGMLCRKKQILSREGLDALKKVAVDISLPAVLFAAFAEAEYTPGSLYLPLIMFVLCLLALGIGFLLRKVLNLTDSLFPFLMTGFEAGMLGYGLFALLYPEKSNSAFAVLDLGQVLFVFTVYKMLLSGKENRKTLARETLSSPVLWAIVTGLVFGATGIFEVLKSSGIAGVITATTDFIAAPTSCLILLTIGYDLELTNIPWKKVTTYLGFRIGVMAILFGTIVLVEDFFLTMRVDRNALLLMVVLPAPYVLPVFSKEEKEKTVIASTLSVMTLFCLAAFALMAVFT